MSKNFLFSLSLFFPPALQVHLFDSNWLFNYTSLFILISFIWCSKSNYNKYICIICDAVPGSLKWISLQLISGKLRLQSLIYFPKTHNLLKILQSGKHPNHLIELAIQVTIYPFSATSINNSSFTANSINIY